MSRTTRALIAGGAAVALLAGSGATFARWYDEKTVPVGGVTTGTLRLVDDGTPGTWTINTAATDEEGDATEAFDPATDKIVPGDHVTYTKTVKLNIVGKNLVADFDMVGDTSTEGLEGLAIDVQPNCNSPRGGNSNLTEADNGATCDVVVDIVYPFGEKDHSAIESNQQDGTHENWNKAEDGMNKPVSLAGVKLVLEQQKRG